MNSDISLEQLAAEIRNIYKAHGEKSAGVVERYLETVLVNYSLEQRMDLLSQLIALFSKNMDVPETGALSQQNAFDRLVTMVLGKEILDRNLSEEEMIEQLASALNTVFDSVNNLVAGMNNTLMGAAPGDETIRVFITASMDREEGIQSLKKFLDQIGEFFAVALEAFKHAADTRINDLLGELDPANLATEDEVGMKFGPMRKAYLYDCFCAKYRKLEEWRRTGVLLQAFLMEFEKNCQTLYARRGE